MKKIILLSILIVPNFFQLLAQEIQINNISLIGTKVHIRYDLIDERIDRSYSINLYTSNDNFIQPMNSVSGDAGVDIPVGGNKLLIWDAKQDLGADFDAGIALELKGNYYVPFINLEGFNAGQVFKRGKKSDIVWTGGRGDNILNFELFQGENLKKTFEERPNNGNTVITFPISVKPGKDYRFRISDSRNRDEVIFTEPFSIKRKVPIGTQLGITFALGAGIGYLVKALIPAKVPDIPLPSVPKRN